jgi:hypothetical protein
MIGFGVLRLFCRAGEQLNNLSPRTLPRPHCMISRLACQTPGAALPSRRPISSR